MAGRYYPGVDSERVNRKAKKLRILMAWAKTMKQKNATGQDQAVKPTSGRGGARAGTGPKVLEVKKRRSLGLSERQWAIFDALGGNDWLRGELDAKPPIYIESL